MAEKNIVVGNYKLGAHLGKGGFGVVYSALDEENGGFYAIKQINLSKIPKDQLTGIMQEIDLLKNLNHPNIVKYVKYIKTKDFLYIVLELVENGSLYNIIKKFGKLPESLVCVYITQVLEGLVYLHEQGVVHRDIKGANILITKEGVVKLADFGVATKFGDESANAVVGTPYWMAPEIIELNGSTTASDLWSVGCTVVELLTGFPPYYELGAMPALFRIVQDDYPPLPEGISPALKDWLMQCFQKDPLLRISAQKLLKHKWITGRRKQTVAEAPKEDVEQIISKYNKDLNDLKRLPKVPAGASSSAATSTPKQIALPPPEDESWDDFGTTPAAGSMKLLPKLDALKANGTPSAAASSSSSSSTPAKAPIPRPLAAARSPHSESASNLHSKLSKFAEDDDDDDSWADFGGGGAGPASSTPQAPLRGMLGPKDNKDKDKDKDKDDDGFGDEDFKPTKLKLPTAAGAGASASAVAAASAPAASANKPAGGAENAKKADATQAAAAAVNENDKKKQANGDGEISNKWGEEEDEGWEDVGGGGQIASAIQKISVQETSRVGSWNLQTRMANRSTAASQATTEEIFEDDEEEGDIDVDINAFAQKDAWSRMNEEILKLMGSLQLGQAENVILSAAQQIIVIFKEHPEHKVHLIRNIGVVPIMEMLEGSNAVVLQSILQVVNQIIKDNTDIKQNLCLVGAIPSIIKFSGREHGLAIRLECAHFVSQMCSTSDLTLQMFIACRGLPILVDFLSTPYAESKALVWMAADAISAVFALKGPTPKNDFCRLFSTCGLLPVLSNVLKSTSEDPEAQAAHYPAKLSDLFLIFSSADSIVKVAMSQPQIISVLFDPIDNDRLPLDVLLKILKAIKQLSMDHNTLANLHQAGTIRRLVRLLARREGPSVTEMHNHALNALYNLCKLDHERQYTAAVEGVIPHLMHVINSASPLRQFALPVLCDLAHVKRARNRYWMANALDSLSVWLLDETERVEHIVATPPNIQKIVQAFGGAEFSTFANLMDPLLHMVTASEKINVGMGTSAEFVPKLLERLNHPKAEVKVNLLRVLTALYKCHPNPKKMIAQFNLYPVVKNLTEDKVVLVQKLASSLLIAFNTNTVV